MSEKQKFQFGNVVVVDDNQIGVIVKIRSPSSNPAGSYRYEVYIRSTCKIFGYPQSEINHFIYSKELEPHEKEFY